MPSEPGKINRDPSCDAPLGDIPWGVIIERRALPDSEWYFPQDLNSVGQYEREMREKGKKPDPKEILRLTKAQKMRLEVNVLSIVCHMQS